MEYYCKVKYKDYINSHMEIMRQRFRLCKQGIEKLEGYEYEAYSYAYYLCSLNLEQLNFLRYIFGCSVNSFFELKMFMAQKFYMICINKYGWPNKIDWKDKRICVHINKTRVVSAHKLEFPTCFKDIEENLEELGSRLEKLAGQYSEIEIKGYFKNKNKSSKRFEKTIV